jgi:hypothetical protein
MRARRLLLALVGLTVVGVGSSIAWASIPDEDGTIHACRHVTTGSLRVIDAETTSCRPREAALSWSSGAGAGLTTVVVRRATGQAAGNGNPTTPSSTVAACEPGERVTGGGIFPPPSLIIVASAPINPGVGFPAPGETASGWVGAVVNPGPNPSGYTVFAMCAS